MRITSADRLRYGLRPRLATLTAMRPPGSSLRTHSAKTSVSISRYSRYDDGTPSRSSSSSYCLPAKYGGDVTTSATDPSAIAVHVAGVAAHERLRDRQRGRDRRRRRTARAGGSGRRTASSRGSRGRPTPKFEVVVLRRSLIAPPGHARPTVRLRADATPPELHACHSVRGDRSVRSGAFDGDTTASDGQAGGPWGPGHRPSSAPPPLHLVTVDPEQPLDAVFRTMLGPALEVPLS